LYIAAIAFRSFSRFSIAYKPSTLTADRFVSNAMHAVIFYQRAVVVVAAAATVSAAVS